MIPDMSAQNRPILVTGAHRTGTTWVGKMLASNGHFAYISEPLNVNHRPGFFQAKVRNWYTYIHEANEADYLPAFKNMLEFRYNLTSEIRSLRSGRDALRMGRDLESFITGKLRQKVPLIKDPFAVFSLNWFATRLNCQIVVTIRHPGGFASSLKRLNWPFDFNDLLNQPDLMRDHLESYRTGIQVVSADDVIGQAGLLWIMIYGFVHAQRRLNPAIQVIRHEDLARDPIPCFRELFQKLGLEFNQKAHQAVLQSTGSDNPSELTETKTHSIKLDSRASAENWKKRISSEEIDRLKKLTQTVSHIYYADSEWPAA